MKRKLLIAVAALFSIGVLSLVILVAINFNDVPLSENVRNVLETKPQYSEQQKNAFYYMVGLYLHADDPMATGKKTFEEYLSLPDNQKAQFWKSHFDKQVPWKVQYGGCSNEPSSGCSIDWIKNHPEELEALKDQPENLQKYIGLIEIGAAADIFESTHEQPFSMIRMFSLDLQRKLILQMIQWAIEGQTSKALDLIEKSNRYNQSLMATGTLLDRMVAAVEIRGLAYTLRDILLHQPKMHLTQSLVDTFTIPPTKEVFFHAMGNEIRFLHFFFESAKLGDFELMPEENNTWKSHLFNAIPVGFLLRHNETLNRYYDLVAISLGQPASADLQDWLNAPQIYHYLENPLGRRLVSVFTGQFEGRMKKFELIKQDIDKARQDFEKNLKAARN